MCVSAYVLFYDFVMRYSCSSALLSYPHPVPVLFTDEKAMLTYSALAKWMYVHFLLSILIQSTYLSSFHLHYGRLYGCRWTTKTQELWLDIRLENDVTQNLCAKEKIRMLCLGYFNFTHSFKNDTFI